MMILLSLKASNKRFVVALFQMIIFLVVLNQIYSVTAAPTTIVEAGSISLYPNNSGNVAITVKEITSSGGLGAYDIKVTFNPSVIQIQDVLGGSSPFSSITAKNIDNTAGTVTFNNFIIATQGPTGSITVAYINIKAIGSAGSSTAISITINSLVDAQMGNEITPRSGSSGTVTILTPKSPSSITIGLDKVEIGIDETVTISGGISPSRLATVTLTFTRPDGSSVTRTTSSGTDGSYTYVFSPDMAGTWGVKASWPGDNDYSGATSSTEAFSVYKLSSTITVSLSPTVIVPGGSLEVRGYVTPPRTGVLVRLEYRLGGAVWTTIADIITNATGGYHHVWSTGLATPGTYEVRASWMGDSFYEGAQSSPAKFSVAGSSSLAISLSCNSTAANSQITVRGQVSPKHEYVNVTVTIETPNGTILARTVKTDAAGNCRLNFIPDTSGVWIFKASWQGDADTLGCESQEARLIVTTTGSTISLETSTPSTIIGNPIEFSGKIEPSPSTSTVTLTLTRPDSSLLSLQTMLTNDGSFSFSYTPDQAGIWLAQASWQGNVNYSGATSLQVSFAVERRISSVTLSSDPPIPKRGDLVTLEGVLTPPFSGNTINVLVSEDGGRTWSTISLCTTITGGRYLASWRAEKIGTFTFKSEWIGNTDYSGCSSNTLTLTIQEEVTSQQVVLPNNDVVEVVLSTNSSSISLTVDAENGRIVANATGQNGTTGVTNIFIPRELLENYGRTINDLVFTVDGVPVTPEITEVAGGYLVTLCYNHSTRIVCIHYLIYSLSVSVLDYCSSAVANANVVLDGPAKTSSFTDSSGTAYFPRLPKGEYTIKVHYGPLVGEDSISLTDNETVTISTVVGELEAEYVDLSAKYQNLETQLNTTTTMMYLFAATTITFIAATAYFVKKKKPT